MELTDIVKEKIRLIVTEWSEYTISNMKNILKAKGKNASGDLIDSLQYEIYNDFNVRIKMMTYGVFVDGGRLPGRKMPPKIEIEKWMMRKGIPIEYSFIVRKNIGKYGIKPTNFTQPFFDGQEKLAEKILKEVGVNILEELKISLESLTIKE